MIIFHYSLISSHLICIRIKYSDIIIFETMKTITIAVIANFYKPRCGAAGGGGGGGAGKA